MKNRLVKLFSLLACGALTVGLSACQNNEPETSSSLEEISSSQESSSSSEDIVKPEPTEGVVYTLSDDGTYAEVYEYEGTATDVVIADTYEGKPVTVISEYAFYGCETLTSVTIPDSVTNIGDYAFSGCSNLKSVNILAPLTAISEGTFEGCTSLTSVTIPASVTSIGASAFLYCERLTEITIPETVASIGEAAFQYCYRLVEVINQSPSITVEKGAESNGYIGFYTLDVYNSDDSFAETKLSNDNGFIIYTEGDEKILVGYNGAEMDVVIPSYVTEINEYAFAYDSLTSVVIPDSVTVIGDYAFNYCGELTSVSLSNSITKIGNWVFGNCDSLTSITLPEGITSIGEGAFAWCSSLTGMNIPKAVTSIGMAAFYSCESLTEIQFEGTVEDWNTITFGDYWNGGIMEGDYIPVEKVVCSDGDVAL